MDRDIPNTNKIKLYLHCLTCADSIPNGESAESYSRLSVGWTKLGLQVWCHRCKVNVVHIDFEGQQHPANKTRQKNPFELAAEAEKKENHLTLVKKETE